MGGAYLLRDPQDARRVSRGPSVGAMLSEELPATRSLTSAAIVCASTLGEASLRSGATWPTVLSTLLLSLVSCVSARVTSSISPRAATAAVVTGESRVLVEVLGIDPLLASMAEEEILERIDYYGLEWFASSELLLDPGDPEGTKAALDQLGVEGFMLVALGDAGTDVWYVPKTGETTTVQGQINWDGTYAETSKTTYQGGYYLSATWASFTAVLLDDEGMLWKAHGKVEAAGAFATEEAIARAIGKATARRFIEDAPE